MVELHPSVLEVPIESRAQALKDTAQSKTVRTIHLDVMDGKFVPRDTRPAQPPSLVQALSKHGLSASVHLMTRRPLVFAREYANAGAREVSFHLEATKTPASVIAALRKEFPGLKIGVSINPRTSEARILPVLKMVDFVLVMTVQPGKGGQAFKHECLKKIVKLKAAAKRAKNSRVQISVDGGVNAKTAPHAVRAGADVLVAGSAVYKPLGTIGKNARALLKAATQKPSTR